MSHPPANQPPYPPPPSYGGGQYGAGPDGPPPANNLVLAILVTILCCLPLGIVAIVFASQVNSKWAMGDVDGARESARKAKLFTIWGAVIGLLVGVVAVILSLAGLITYEVPTTT